MCKTRMQEQTRNVHYNKRGFERIRPRKISLDHSQIYIYLDHSLKSLSLFLKTQCFKTNPKLKFHRFSNIHKIRV